MKSHQNSVTTAILVAAGRGLRAGGGIPKQWRSIAGQSVAAWTLNVFQAHPQVDHIVVVTNDDDPHANNILDMFDGIRRVSGGHSRGASVHNGLLAAPEGTTHVLIHDIARPCISGALISKIIASIASNMCAAPALPVTDALWRGRDGGVEGTQERENLYRAQTPQGFALDAILDAHAQFSGPAADDVEVARAAGHRVAIVPGDEANIKITTEQDFDRAEQILAARYAGEKKMDIRVGNGFDVHQFTEGDHVTLCGVDIPHTHRLKGHSDADVGLHTITDAIYGALAQGDIGTHFPPSDPQWKGAASHIFLEHARDLAAKMGFSLTHVDCTLICEMPKIGPNALTMRQKVSEILNISLDRISVKATTSEGLGFTGRGEGIACMATATLVKTS